MVLVLTVCPIHFVLKNKDIVGQRNPTFRLIREDACHQSPPTTVHSRSSSS